MIPRLLSAAAFAAVLFVPAVAATVGRSEPATELTQARINALQMPERAAWQAYFERSAALRAADKKALADERASLTQVPPPPPEHGHDASMPLNHYPEWYACKEARHIADTIVSFQTPAGGWGKNMDRGGAARLPGQAYVPNNISQYLAPGDFDTPHEPDWNYVGTLDNDATSTEMFFLAAVIVAAPGPEGDAYRAAFVKGVRYLLDAQYPNGGWPQVYPLEGGYHDAITYNDNAVTEAASVLTEVAANAGGAYAFVPVEMRAAAAEAAKKALDVILKTQVRDAQGHLTIWGQQHDALTLAPASARNFEPALPSTEESADLLVYLMRLRNPSPELQASIHAAAAFLKKTAIVGFEWKKGENGRLLTPKPGAGPLWARYYTAEGRPRFGDRDTSIHDDVSEISLERRNGYSWFNTSPAKALKAYEVWAKTYPVK